MAITAAAVMLAACDVSGEAVKGYPKEIQSLIETPLKPDGDLIVSSNGQIRIGPDTVIGAIEGYTSIVNPRSFFQALGQGHVSPSGYRGRSSEEKVCQSGTDIVYFLGITEGSDVPVRRTSLAVWQSDGLTQRPSAWWYAGRIRQHSNALGAERVQVPPYPDYDYKDQGGIEQANRSAKINLTALIDRDEIESHLLEYLNN